MVYITVSKTLIFYAEFTKKITLFSFFTPPPPPSLPPPPTDFLFKISVVSITKCWKGGGGGGAGLHE